MTIYQDNLKHVYLCRQSHWFKAGYTIYFCSEPIKDLQVFRDKHYDFQGCWQRCGWDHQTLDVSPHDLYQVSRGVKLRPCAGPVEIKGDIISLLFALGKALGMCHSKYQLKIKVPVKLKRVNS